MSDYLENAEVKMMSAIENLESNLHTIRTGRASAQMLDRVQVDYYGSMTPINQMAQIQVVEGTQLVIRPYDRQIIKGINWSCTAVSNWVDSYVWKAENCCSKSSSWFVLLT